MSKKKIKIPTTIKFGHGLWVFANVADAVTTYLATGNVQNGVELNPVYSLPLKVAVTVAIPFIMNHQYKKVNNVNYWLFMVALYYFIIAMVFTVALNTAIMLWLNNGGI